MITRNNFIANRPFEYILRKHSVRSMCHIHGNQPEGLSGWKGALGDYSVSCCDLTAILPGQCFDDQDAIRAKTH